MGRPDRRPAEVTKLDVAGKARVEILPNRSFSAPEVALDRARRLVLPVPGSDHDHQPARLLDRRNQAILCVRGLPVER